MAVRWLVKNAPIVFRLSLKFRRSAFEGLHRDSWLVVRVFAVPRDARSIPVAAVLSIDEPKITESVLELNQAAKKSCLLPESNERS